MTKEILIALALQHCPWVPDPIPYLYLYDDARYETSAVSHQGEELRHSYAFYSEASWYNLTPSYIVMRKSTANERVLCHEWRHAVEGGFHLRHDYSKRAER